MPVSIHAIEKALFKVFSNDFAFSIPPYQRPYAWTPDQASELLTDLLALGEIEWVKPLRRGRFPGQILGKRP
jgi:uncharacterized protein with ParB-like and HNH nuclease domain